MSVSPTIIIKEYIRTEDDTLVKLKLEVRYKEFDTIIDSEWIHKLTKTVEEIKMEALMTCQSAIQTFIAECDAGDSIVGSIIPLPNNFL